MLQVASLAPELASSSSGTKAAAEVTQIALAPGSSNQLAAGYSDGTVRIWEVKTHTCLVTLSGHSGEGQY
jgi:U3 small nucleolar RNA-associated protein 12